MRYAIDLYQKPTVEQLFEEIAFAMGMFGFQIEDSDDSLADWVHLTTVLAVNMITQIVLSKRLHNYAGIACCFMAIQ